MILQAALREFAEQGYEGATTASIARRVGVTQPLVHYHFGSKQALWRATVDSLFTALNERIALAEKDVAGMGPAARLITLTYDFIEFLVENPELARLMVNEGVVHTPRLTWLVDNHIRPMFRKWEGFVDEGKRAGLIKDIHNAYILFAFLGALEHFFDLAPLVKELFGLDARSPETARGYGNALIEIFLEGAATRDFNAAHGDEGAAADPAGEDASFVFSPEPPPDDKGGGSA